jgi:hypothetical protein
MLIDRTYFVGELNIPNTSQAAIGSLTDHFIAKYEEEWLREVLGYTLHKAFRAGWQAPSPAQKWTDLVDGVEYTSNAKTKFWRGLVSAVSGESSFDLSPIANYVYYWYIRNNYTQTSTMSEVKATNENAAIANPSLKMVRAWNEMSQWICELVDYLDAKKDDYTEWADQDVWRMRKKFRPINEFNI